MSKEIINELKAIKDGLSGMESRLSVKLDTAVAGNESRLGAKLDARMDRMESKFDSRMALLESDMVAVKDDTTALRYGEPKRALVRRGAKAAAGS